MHQRAFGTYPWSAVIHLQRTLRRALPFLALGALLTVASTWSLALTGAWLNPTLPTDAAAKAYLKQISREPPPLRQWPDWCPPDWPDATHAFAQEGLTWRLSGQRCAPGEAGAIIQNRPPRSVSYGRLDRGFPFLAMTHHAALSLNWGAGQYTRFVPPGFQGILNGGIRFERPPAPGGIPQALILPLRPLFPGFLLNTLAYAILAWTAVASLTNSRARLRTRRGTCPKCAYDLTNLTTCPECGTPKTHDKGRPTSPPPVSPPSHP